MRIDAEHDVVTVLVDERIQALRGVGAGPEGLTEISMGQLVVVLRELLDQCQRCGIRATSLDVRMCKQCVNEALPESLVVTCAASSHVGERQQKDVPGIRHIRQAVVPHRVLTKVVSPCLRSFESRGNVRKGREPDHTSSAKVGAVLVLVLDEEPRPANIQTVDERDRWEENLGQDRVGVLQRPCLEVLLCKEVHWRQDQQV
mmetsp:Transcript_51540/g.167257  ORF Transcript_51540/g.167257 Transcript_51540/m.167257 type:complete len:202 (-) Transcript_51540:245-850(-)